MQHLPLFWHLLLNSLFSILQLFTVHLQCFIGTLAASRLKLKYYGEKWASCSFTNPALFCVFGDFSEPDLYKTLINDITSYLLICIDHKTDVKTYWLKFLWCYVVIRIVLQTPKSESWRKSEKRFYQSDWDWHLIHHYWWCRDQQHPTKPVYDFISIVLYKRH